MSAPNIASWVRIGALALPVYGLLTLWATLTHQPDPNADFEAYSRYVTSDTYLVKHLVGSIFGTLLAVLGAIALGSLLAGGQVGRMALLAMVSSVVGHCLVLTIFGMSTFATPAVGRAYLAGEQGIVQVNQDIIGVPLMVTALAGGLLYSAGTILFGIAVWRSEGLPRWAGIPYAPTGFLISILGLMVGASQTVGSLLLIAGSGWIAWSILHEPAATFGVAKARPGAQ